MKDTKIEWAEHTFNPWIGCTRISPACDHCYAARIDHRFGGGHWGAGAPRKRTSVSNWAQPRRWDKQAAEQGVRARVFCASLADVFDNEVPRQWRLDLFELIRETPFLDWLLLTKRIGNVMAKVKESAELAFTLPRRLEVLDMLTDWWLNGDAPHNIWLGATVVNQAEADRDVPKLLATPARIRFLSIEPMLGPISLDISKWGKCYHSLHAGRDHLAKHAGCPCHLDWVIAGGESGPQARPSHPDWFRSLRDQCADAGVPFLFKQWGEYRPARMDEVEHMDIKSPFTATIWPDGTVGHGDHEENGGYGGLMYKAGKKAAGRALDGETHDGIPQ